MTDTKRKRDEQCDGHRHHVNRRSTRRETCGPAMWPYDLWTHVVGPHTCIPLATGRPLWKLSHRYVGNYFYFWIFNISCNEKLKPLSCSRHPLSHCWWTCGEDGTQDWVLWQTLREPTRQRAAESQGGQKEWGRPPRQSQTHVQSVGVATSQPQSQDC